MASFLRTITFPFMLLAAIGLALSFYTHTRALFGLPVPWGGSVWLLHVGIFVVWFPAVLVAQRLVRHSSQKDFWKVALLGCPGWMRATGIVLFAYAILNFLYFILLAERGMQAGEGSTIRGFSGHWLIFYGAAFAILYSARARPDLLEGFKCPNGHDADPLAQFCSSCGARIARAAGEP
jgi:hypothetical protein